MTELGQYTVSVCCAGIFFAVILSLLPEKGLTSTVTRHICGVVTAFVVISPLKQIRLGDYIGIYDSLLYDAQAASAVGEQQTEDALADIIKQRSEAYILDKAQAMGVNLDVEITLSRDDLPVPVSARIGGTVSPFIKLRLQRLLTEELGIAKENQLWTG